VERSRIDSSARHITFHKIKKGAPSLGGDVDCHVIIKTLQDSIFNT
jgi:hypothetical protein